MKGGAAAEYFLCCLRTPAPLSSMLLAQSRHAKSLRRGPASAKVPGAALPTLRPNVWTDCS